MKHGATRRWPAISTLFEIDRVSTRSLGYLAGGLFVSANILCGATAPLLESQRVRQLEPIAAFGVLIGVVFMFLPWNRWPRSALVAPSLVGLVQMAIASRIAPGWMDNYLSIFTLIFVFIGLTQTVRVLMWMVPAGMVSFVASGSGATTLGSGVRFAVTLVTAAAIGWMLSMFIGQSRASNRLVADLVDVTQALVRSKRVVDTVRILESSTNQFVHSDEVFTFVSSEPGSTRFATVLPTPTGLPEQLAIDVLNDSSGLSHVLDSGEPMFVRSLTDDVSCPIRLRNLVGCESALFLPLQGEEGRLGAVVFCWREMVACPPDAALRAISLLGTEATALLERQRAAEQVEVEAATDPLTGLLNRRAIDHRLRSLSAGDAIIMLDLDRFKEVNDSIGHAGGDRTLRSLAACLVATCRHDDWCARLGGDEFLVVLRGGGDGGARSVLAELCQAWRASGPATSFSAGAAVARAGEQAGEVMGRADDSLYEAKRLGRDRVEISIAPAS